jgi:hypothetical protein
MMRDWSTVGGKEKNETAIGEVLVSICKPQVPIQDGFMTTVKTTRNPHTGVKGGYR